MHVTLIGVDDEVWASGLRGISAALRDAGHDTTMVFAGGARDDMDERAIDAISSLARDSAFIGVSSMSRGSKRAKWLIEGLRPSGKLIVWGGMHPTLYPEDCVGHADLVCRGEGEGFALELLERLAAGRALDDMPNAAYLRDSQMVTNPLRPLIADLDDLPFPDFSFEREYIVVDGGRLEPNSRMLDAHTVLFSGSRGCNNSCAYCSNSQLKAIYRGQGSYARKMSVAHFVRAAARCREVFPKVHDFYFTDEDFFARPVDELAELAETYPEAVGLPFEVMASPRQITEEKVELAVRSGMWRIDIGLESGSERTRREVFNRYVSDDIQLAAAATVARHRDLVAYYFLILGNPYERREDLLAGISLLGRMPAPFFLRAYNLVFIPGTKLFDRALTDKIIAGIDDSAYDLDFLGGYDPHGHEWKRRNLYLNALTSLMIGKSTPGRMGWVLRPLIPLLTRERVVAFCERHPWIGEAMASQANLGLRLRRGVSNAVEALFGDQRVVYRLTTSGRGHARPGDADATPTEVA